MNTKPIDFSELDVQNNMENFQKVKNIIDKQQQ